MPFSKAAAAPRPELVLLPRGFVDYETWSKAAAKRGEIE